jgi:NADH-quinone oxidoreductase subunit K
MIGLTHYLVVAAILFILGLLTVVSRRNTIAILMGVELMLNAASLNFVAFNRFAPGFPGAFDGQIFSLFIIVLAAAEAAVALAIIFAFYTINRTVDADAANSLMH